MKLMNQSIQKIVNQLENRKNILFNDEQRIILEEQQKK